MLRPIIATTMLAAALQACAYPSYVNDEYRYIPLTTFAHENQSYRIFDKPSAGKLIVTPSLATAVSDTVIRNVTFDRYNNTTAPRNDRSCRRRLLWSAKAASAMSPAAASSTTRSGSSPTPAM